MTSSEPLNNEPQQHSNANIDDDFPEGGWRAWSVVLGAWCAMIPSMGMLNTIGVLEAWIGENQLAALPKSQTAWVVSLYAFFLYIGGSCAGAIFDRYGLRPVIIPSSVGMVASMMCLSVSKGIPRMQSNAPWFRKANVPVRQSIINSCYPSASWEACQLASYSPQASQQSAIGSPNVKA